MFDREAILYRHDSPDRQMYRTSGKSRFRKHRKDGTGPYSDLLFRVYWVEHPAQWQVCGGCHGKNTDHPDCDRCGGAGFRLKIGTPGQ